MMQKKEMVRCKACGFIIEKGQLGEVCPACGVKKEMFELYEDKVGAFRRWYLSLDLHPVVVHAPQAFAFTILIGALLYLLLPGEWRVGYLNPFLTILSWAQILVVFGGFATGLVDGKVRYRKVTTPILKTKILLATLFLLAAITNAVLLLVGRLDDLMIWIFYVIAAAVAMGASTLLGLLGTSLIHGAMPGDKILMGGKKKPKAAPKPAEEKKE